MDLECHDDCNAVAKKTAAKEHVIIMDAVFGPVIWTMSIVVLYQNSYINVLFWLKLNFSQYPSIHTNYIISHCTTL